MVEYKIRTRYAGSRLLKEWWTGNQTGWDNALWIDETRLD